MQAFCHSDVQLLHIGMQRFHEMFLEQKENKGHNIGADPFNNLTIAGVAFSEFFSTYFAQECNFNCEKSHRKQIICLNR